MTMKAIVCSGAAIFDGMPAQRNQDGIFNVPQKNPAKESLSRATVPYATIYARHFFQLTNTSRPCGHRLSGDLSGFGTAGVRAMLNAHQTG